MGIGVSSALLLVPRLVLAVLFATAGAAKLADRGGSKRAALEFGVPPRLVGGLAVALPLAELAIAGALLVPDSAAYGAIAAFVLLVAFCVVIGSSMAQGRSPDCHCFGQLHSAPAGPATLARNVILAAVAAVTAVLAWSDPGPSPLAWLGDLGDTALVAVTAAALIAVLAAAGVSLAIHLLRAHGRLLVRFEDLEARLGSRGAPLVVEHQMPQAGLPVGSQAPAFELASAGGDAVSLADLLEPGHPLLLVFADPECGPCRVLMPDVAAWQRDHGGELTIAVIEAGAEDDARRIAKRNRLSGVLVDGDETVAQAFEAYGTPSAVLVGPDGLIAGPVAQGAAAIQALVGRALAQHVDADPVGLAVGDPIPDLRLPTLDGEAFALESLSGDDALLVFWNPSCGFCRAIRDDLLVWEAARRDGAPRLIVISSGDREATRAEGFGSTVLLDEGHEAGRAFRAGGTPMAVLVDAQGHVASPLAAGSDAVLTLAREGARAAA